MKHKKSILSLFCLLILGITELNAQAVITTTGNTATGSDGSATYTVGQVVYTTNIGTNGSVLQGIQQPYEISVVSGIENKEISLGFTAYPNPTTDFLNLKVENYEKAHLSYTLFDISGKLLETKRIVDNETNISMANLAPATYFIKITDSKKIVKTFKIIKN